ncbi:MAG: uL15m family ribosomal protein, partial [Nitrospirota bacterium]
AITPGLLMDAGIIKKSAKAIKVLGDGELNKPLTIKAHKFSKSALEKIQAAGGKAEVL